MPLYEYLCDGCRITFEALLPLSASQSELHTCPSCGEGSRRILSAVNFAAGSRTSILRQGQVRAGKLDVTSLTLPPAARLCWMDNQSAARLAAYKAGRGAEYEDTIAVRKELAAQHGNGDNEDAKSAPLAHSHSPLSDPLVFANRREAAQKEKLAESATIRKGEDTKKTE
jgi:putative FmdB family regulatory protein